MYKRQGIPCFTAGTLIKTARGPCPVETLRVGDLLQTADNGLQQVMWVGISHIEGAALRANPRLRPITLQPGGILNLPHPMTVSRQHRFVLNDTDQAELFLRANQLHQLAPEQAPSHCPQHGVTYVHVLLERHEVIFAGGIPTESFYPGPWSLRGLSNDAQAELTSLLPDLRALRPLHPRLARIATDKIYSPLARKEISTADLGMRITPERLQHRA